LSNKAAGMQTFWIRLTAEQAQTLYELGITTPKRWPGGPPPALTHSISVGVRRLFDLVLPEDIADEIALHKAAYAARCAKREAYLAKQRERIAAHDYDPE